MRCFWSHSHYTVTPKYAINLLKICFEFTDLIWWLTDGLTSRAPVVRSITVTSVLQDILVDVEWSLQQSQQLKEAAVSIIFGFLLRPGRERSIAISLSVCVCLSVRQHISAIAGRICTKYVVRIPGGRGSVLLWRCCDTLCTSGFMDDVTFGRSGPCGGRCDARAESDVCECIVRFVVDFVVLVFCFCIFCPVFRYKNKHCPN